MKIRTAIVVAFVLFFCIGVYRVEATEEETIAHHLQAIGDGDIDAIIADYAEDAMLFTTDNVLHGTDEIKSFFESIIADVLPPGSGISIFQQIIEGEFAYIIWSADSANYNIPLGTDTFVMRDDKIAIHTFGARMIPKTGAEFPLDIRFDLPESPEKDVFMSRLQAIAGGDVDAVISSYAEDAILIMANGVLHGRDEISMLFAGGLSGGGLPFQLSQAVIEGEVAYTVWSAESTLYSTPFGTDTLIIRDGMIVAQTSAAQVMPAKEDFSHTFSVSLEQGLNMISLPLKPMTPYTARSFAQEMGANVVIDYDETLRRFVGFTMDAPGDGFPIEGGKGYIVNVPTGGMTMFTGAAWTGSLPAPSLSQSSNSWAFVVSGSVFDGGYIGLDDDSYTVMAKNLRTGDTATAAVHSGGYFAAVWADLSRNSVIEIGDRVETAVMDSDGKIVSGPFVYQVTLDEIGQAVMDIRLKLGKIIPAKSIAFQNYPNPFNPETWIPYQLMNADSVSIRIYSASGQMVREMNLGYKDAGVYTSRSDAAYWDGKNEAGEEVVSGIYFYNITADGFSSTGKMTVRR